MLEMTQAGREMSDEELKENPAVEQEWDIQWEIFRLLAECEERDIELIKGLRADLREAGLLLTEKIVIQHKQMRGTPGEIRCPLLRASERVVILLNWSIGG